MSGDWIKMKKNLFSDPRVVRMMSALKADKFRTVGGLMSAWCLADDHTEDGHLHGYTPDILDEQCHFPGLAAAMISVGWLQWDGEKLIFPRFCEHNGQSAKRRAQDRVRKMSAREEDKKRTREEKRREEYNTYTHRADGFEAEWERWVFYAESINGRRNAIQEETWLLELTRRGAEKARRDIDFSIGKGAKSILDSDHDFQRSARAGTGGGSRKVPSLEEGVI